MAKAVKANGDQGAGRRAGGGAGILIALQAGSRLCNMLFAQLQVRLVSAEAFGAANIHLELLLGTTLNIAREGVRNALSRKVVDVGQDAAGDGADRDGIQVERRIQNVALLPLPIGLVTAIAGVTLYAQRLAPSQLASHPHFNSACVFFLLGIVLELISEPLYVAALRAQHLQPRVWAEGAGTLARGAMTLAVMLFLPRTSGGADQAANSILPFGFGQMAFGATFLLVFVIDSIRRLGWSATLQIYGIGRKVKAKGSTFDAESLRLSRSMAQQNIVKHCLGEADKFAVARLVSLKDQGAYALASNYGSLVARLLYQPVEESAGLMFASTLGSLSGKKKADDVRRAETLLCDLLAFHGLLTAFLMVFCSPLATPLLVVVAGQRWAVKTQAPTILAAYGSTYLPAMAFNGLLEGFLQACAAPAELARYDGVLVGASFLYVLATAFFTKYHVFSPEIALIVSSSASTLLRASYSFAFAKRFLARTRSQRKDSGSQQQLTLRSLTPSAQFLLAMLLSAIPLWRSSAHLEQNDWQLPWKPASRNHVVLGTTLAVLCASMCAFTERRTLLGAYRAIVGRGG